MERNYWLIFNERRKPEQDRTKSVNAVFNCQREAFDIFYRFQIFIFKKEYQSAKIDKAKINSYGGI